MKWLNIHHKRYGKFTSESVSSGHPDKICDQIADNILDHALKANPDSRVACEVVASNRLILIGGEVTTTGYIDVVKCAWDVLMPLGYKEDDFTIISNIHSQSSEIAKSVNIASDKIGAGDQGITIGYAVRETDELIPLGTMLAHELLIQAELLRLSGNFPELKSDMKSQVTLEYQGNNVRVNEVLISAQHAPNTNMYMFRNRINNEVIIPILLKRGLMDSRIGCLINPSGSFVVGGPIGDTGLTGRKLMVDTYGNYAHHGGGAFSGKDYTKVDRTGAYYARWIAKHIVSLDWATECEVRIAWSIGMPRPLNIEVECFGTNKIPLDKIRHSVLAVFNHELSEIIKLFNMKRMSYKPLATYGHFGRNYGKWEDLPLLLNLLHSQM